MDYAQFSDVVTFDTTYKLNKEHRPFESFVGFNHHRETLIFGAALLYDETAESFVWLFQNFLVAMSRKVPKALFTDQDAAIAKAIPIVMHDTSHRLYTWDLMQNALKHVNCLFQDKGVNGVLNKFLFDIEDENQWKLDWEEMLDKYDAHDNHWLKLTFAVKEKWGWPYVRSTWVVGMSTTQLSESFNAFLTDYIYSDFNLNEFFMNFERVLYEKRYKELEVGYALCQRLPKVKATIRMLIQMGNVYTKKIFEEFQNEYFQSIESHIEAIEYGEASTIYTVVDVGSNHARKVKMERDGSLGCNCTKFEREGILCCHSLKVIRDILKMKEIPLQYILKRWTKQVRAEIVKDITGNDIQLATLGANVERKLSAHFAIENEVSNDDATQSFKVDYEDVNHVVQPKGLKKKVATSKGKRRVKGEFEAAFVANSKKKSRANSLASSKSVASPIVTPSPLSIGKDIYVHQHVPPLHPLPLSLAMGGNSIPPPLMYPTYHSLLQGSCGYDIGFRYSQESNSPMCSQFPSSFGMDPPVPRLSQNHHWMEELKLTLFENQFLPSYQPPDFPTIFERYQAQLLFAAFSHLPFKVLGDDTPLKNFRWACDIMTRGHVPVVEPVSPSLALKRCIDEEISKLRAGDPSAIDDRLFIPRHNEQQEYVLGPIFREAL
ncbi:protein FAR1-RELATED SEQUENCE 5-like [Camellia sinensis]|uniref:protein FAR1-RELATED SEQUENCE 5-like n=1 Tax=Camellia sinensis TaxID=4442 RepID=UPI00103650D9|nr:protein FAR1-RELATED SEQUENCE 5-like [Camellia sinensis]